MKMEPSKLKNYAQFMEWMRGVDRAMLSNQEVIKVPNKLDGGYSQLYILLTQRVAGFNFQMLVQDGLAILSLLHSKRANGDSPKVMVIGTDGDGKEIQFPIQELLSLKSFPGYEKSSKKNAQ